MLLRINMVYCHACNMILYMLVLVIRAEFTDSIAWKEAVNEDGKYLLHLYLIYFIVQTVY